MKNKNIYRKVTSNKNAILFPIRNCIRKAHIISHADPCIMTRPKYIPTLNVLMACSPKHLITYDAVTITNVTIEHIKTHIMLFPNTLSIFSVYNLLTIPTAKSSSYTDHKVPSCNKNREKQ